jgi:hypothetical protein
MDPSTVVGLWKDPGRGTREIPLEAGAQGVLVSVNTDRAIRRSSDGRLPVENGSEIFDMSIYQVRAATTGSGWSSSRSGSPTTPLLETDELTILTSWSEALAEALACTPERVEPALAAASARAPWRAALGIAEPSARLSEAIDCVARTVRTPTDSDQPLESLLLALSDGPQGEPGLERLVHRVLRSALEQRLTRQAKHGGSFPADLAR